MLKLPPLPVGVAPGSGYWNDWYEKLRTMINSFASGFPFSSITGLPTTLSGYGITDAERLSNKNIANGYSGLNAATRSTKGIDSTDDLIIDLATKGLVLKDTQGTPHYWRVTINNVGALVSTDLGTTKP